MRLFKRRYCRVLREEKRVVSNALCAHLPKPSVFTFFSYVQKYIVRLVGVYYTECMDVETLLSIARSVACQLERAEAKKRSDFLYIIHDLAGLASLKDGNAHWKDRACCVYQIALHYLKET